MIRLRFGTALKEAEILLNPGNLLMPLELVCCKKRQRMVPDQLLVWGIRAL